MKNFLFLYLKKNSIFLSVNLLQNIFLYFVNACHFQREINILQKRIYIETFKNCRSTFNGTYAMQPIKRFNDTFSSNRKIVKRSEIRNLEIHRIDRGCIEDAFCYKSISESVFEIRATSSVRGESVEWPKIPWPSFVPIENA